MTSQVRPFDPRPGAEALLETGDVLWLRDGFFAVEVAERPLLTPSVLAGANKNVSFDPATGRVSGASATGESAERLRGLLARFSDEAEAFVRLACPATPIASRGPDELSSGRNRRTRIVVAEGRHAAMSTAFPPLRCRISGFSRFANVNPDGRPRSWRWAKTSAGWRRAFAPRLRAPMPGTALLLHVLHLTKSRRSAYDALMLQLHDRMKEDTAYQSAAPQQPFDFPPGSAWIAFTDQVSHAAMSGQHQLEQTFLLPVGAMLDEGRSPLRILEGLKGRSLIE
jgi:hypothetical protein